jgi:hypothetical protein
VSLDGLRPPRRRCAPLDFLPATPPPSRSRLPTTPLSEPQRPERGLWLVWAGALIVFGAAAHLALWFWLGGVPLDVTSGVWTALAKDFADGVLYRPVFGPMGYGGTRYMPLFFLAHGALMRLGVDPVVGGLGLTLASAAAFDLALYASLRQLDVRPALALPFAVLGHATISMQLLTLGTRCDLLASAFNLAGVALALRYVRRPGRLTLAGMVAALAAAFFTKLTTVSGIIAAIAFLRTRCGARTARVAAMGWLALLAAGSLALYAASGGRIWSSFLAVGSGGIGWSYGARFPFWFALAVVEDPFYLLVFLFSLFYAVRELRQGRSSFAVGYFWVATAATVPVFASPGTDNNHLIDLLGASLLLLGRLCGRRAGSARLALLLPPALAGLTMVGWVPGMVSIGSVIAGMGRPERQTISAIVRRAGSGDRILSEDPLIPVLAGRAPFLSDPFSLHILAKKIPEVRADFDLRMKRGDFPTVVLVDWSGSDAAHAIGALRARTDRGVDHFYGGVRFTDDFLDLLDRYYAVTMVEHPFVVFQRRRRPAS